MTSKLRAAVTFFVCAICAMLLVSNSSLKPAPGSLHSRHMYYFCRFRGTVMASRTEAVASFRSPHSVKLGRHGVDQQEDHSWVTGW
jgi:hypothetical protein